MVPSSLFILAFSVCNSLQFLISTLTQGGESGHLFRLTCCGEGGKLQTNITGMCGRARSEWATLGLPQLTAACAFQFYTAQAPGCSAGLLSKVSPAFRVLPRSTLHRFRFGYSIRPQTRLGVHFVPFPGPSSSGNQVVGEHTVPGGSCI